VNLARNNSPKRDLDGVETGRKLGPLASLSAYRDDEENQTGF
jgi:hypothetical protein